MNIVIIGIGPHFRRTYMQYLDKYKIYPMLLVELESERKKVQDLLIEKKWNNTTIFTILDKYKNAEILPKKYEILLDKICKEKSITHAIIATEPKGHLMYLNFFLKKGIHTLTDKPLICFDNMLNVDNIKRLQTIYKQLVTDCNSVVCKILCQRNYHKGYKYVRELVKQIILRYNIPITYISVYSCDGNWVFPHDLDYENHPYKYGYGKMFHSGYHFIDLLVGLLKLNKYVSDEKRITKAKMFNCFVTPQDELDVVSLIDYKRFFKNETFPSYYDKQNSNYDEYGEKDVFTKLELLNNKNRIITIADLNILESGFSRRGWLHTREDRYKGNGRVRHESINIQIGPLLNIQIHSYQSKEIKDRSPMEEYDFGGLDHFDIDIYRNIDIIGGKPYERIRSNELYDFSNEKYFVGLNELGRQDAISAFFSLQNDENDLKNHKDSMELLYQLCMSYYCYKKNNKQIIRKFKFNI